MRSVIEFLQYISLVYVVFMLISLLSSPDTPNRSFFINSFLVVFVMVSFIYVIWMMHQGDKNE